LFIFVDIERVIFTLNLFVFIICFFNFNIN